MSEKMYAVLLRLYPSHFRNAYGDEAIELLRDRSRDEPGFFPTLRLWFDLLADLIVSLPQEYRYLDPSLVAAVSRQGLEGVPSFYVLEDSSPRLRAFFFGGILALAVLVTVSALIFYAGDNPTPSASSFHSIAPTHMRYSPSESTVAQNLEGAKLELAADASPPSPIPQPEEQNPAGTSGQRANDSGKLDAAERQRVIERAIANLKQYYFDRDVAQKTADALLAHEKNGDDNGETHGSTFADLLTTQMRAASRDMHLEMDYSEDPLPAGLPAQTADSRERYRKAMLEQNCMFRKVEVFPHHIGYLKLDFFPDTSVCAATARTAMNSLNNTDAIIFDLRDNTGGFDDMVSLIASYLFDHPEYMYGPRGAPTEDSWTRSPVRGNRLADKPVYVLTSGMTWSGAEQFTYDLKMLKRATLVGETTRGGAHAGAFHRIDDHFGMGIPEEKAINPFGKADWEGVGVEPDVKVKATDALETAVKLAEAKLRKK